MKLQQQVKNRKQMCIFKDALVQQRQPLLRAHNHHHMIITNDKVFDILIIFLSSKVLVLKLLFYLALKVFQIFDLMI